MVVSEEEKNTNQQSGKELFLEYPWFYENVYGRLQNTLNEFFQREYIIRFMGVSYNDENVLFFGDEYFVNKMEINPVASAIIRISSGVISSILDNTLGAAENKFSIDNLTDIEAMLIKSFTLFMYNKLEGLFIKTEPNKKILKKAKTYNFTFYVQYNEKHTGKIIISVPDYVLNDNIEFEYREDCFDISSFENTSALVTLRFGSARISLNDIKSIEVGDVIMLEESNVNKMALIWEGNLVEFNITPNPTLIISVDKNGDEQMDGNSELNNENMWDTILVDVVAEFDNFKLTLGELKQISEGLVIDVGSVYNNKVKLRVAKQVVASGELVILNDRYGVRIDSVKNGDNVEYDEVDDDDFDTDDDDEETSTPAANAPKHKANKKAVKNQAQNTGEETTGASDGNFDYSDFEIEDESI